MKILRRPSFWIKLVIFFGINLALCFLLGMLLSSDGISDYYRTIKKSELNSYLILSFAIAFAFTLWTYNDPLAKRDTDDKKKKRRRRSSTRRKTEEG